MQSFIVVAHQRRLAIRKDIGRSVIRYDCAGCRTGCRTYPRRVLDSRWPSAADMRSYLRELWSG